MRQACGGSGGYGAGRAICVGGAVGHVARASGVHLLAQHGDDPLAEQVELLEHGRERQAGVVDQEELALVVAEVLAGR